MKPCCFVLNVVFSFHLKPLWEYYIQKKNETTIVEANLTIADTSQLFNQFTVQWPLPL